MVGISAEKSNAREVHGDKCRKVKCMGGAWEVYRRCAGGGGDKCRKVKCTRGAWEVVGISAERSNAQEVCLRWWVDKCRKVKCTGGAREVVGISAERSNAQEVCLRWWG